MHWADNSVEAEALLRMHLRDYGDVLVSRLVRNHGRFLEAHRPRWRIGHRKVMHRATMGI